MKKRHSFFAPQALADATITAYWATAGLKPPKLDDGHYDQPPLPPGHRNPYWEIIREYHLDDPSRFGMPSSFDRHHLCMTFAWSIISPGDVAWMKERLNGRGVVEVGAGKGYWAAQLAQAGVDVVAYDPAFVLCPFGSPEFHSTTCEDCGGSGFVFQNKYATGNPWFPVQRGNHAQVALHPDRTLLLCWPTYDDSWAQRALAVYEGSQLFYAGEGWGGCCADDSFFETLDSEWEEVDRCPAHLTYVGIHCDLTEYRRRAAPRPQRACWRESSKR